ncbi:MAG TPA: putative glycolipid-binding domain-containing protein [bacterium]
MIKPVAIYLWRRVDQPGHDSCRLFKLTNGWRLRGAAILLDNGKPCHLQYELAAGGSWKTRNARVAGYIGRKAVDLRIAADGATRWQVNGVLNESVNSCVDVDLGFTPATNLIAIRRLALKVGQRVEAPAAYLQFPEMRLVKLPQSYRRTGRTEYQYEAPTVGYSGTLQVLPIGAVSRYPGLSELVESG